MTVPTAGAYPEQGQATTILILGILSIVCCGPLGIAAWIMGNNELKAIAEGRRPPENRGTANAGRICGIVGVVLFGVGIIVGIILVVSSVAIFPFSEFNI